MKSLIHPFLDMVYGFRLGASENRRSYAHINYLLPFLYETEMISIISYKYGKSFIETIPLPASSNKF